MPQQIALGDKLYLHRPDRPFDPDEFHLLISAHGAVLPGSFTTPEWGYLHFYGRHGAAIYDPGFRNIIEGKYEVTESVGGGEACSSYLLSKYQGSHGNVRETYDSLQDAVRSNSDFLDLIRTLMASDDERKRNHAQRTFKGRDNFAFHFDVLTIRNRWFAKFGVTLNYVLSQLDHHGYRYNDIHCSFCRWRPGGGSVSAREWGS